MFARRAHRFFSNKSLCKCLSTVPEAKPQNLKIPNKDVKSEPVDLLNHPDYFNVHKLFTIKDLFNARVHYGHKEGSLNNKMKPFIFGSRLDHLVFDLDITAHLLREALNFIAHVAFRDGIILFVSRNPAVTIQVENLAKECGEFALAREWRRGIFTNLVHTFGCVTRLPDLCIFFNTLELTGEQHIGIVDCAKMNVPTVAIVDTNCDPNLVTYPIPGNDDSLESFNLYASLFKEVVLRGKKERLKSEKSETVRNEPQT